MKTLRILLLLTLLFSGVVARAQIRAHYINVGQADSILVEFRGAAILIDAGGEATGGTDPSDPNRDRDHLLAYLDKFFTDRANDHSLPNLNRTLLAVIISHPHIDHTKNLMAVMQRFTVRNLIDGGDTSGSGISQLNAARAFAQTHQIQHVVIKDNMIPPPNGLAIFPELVSSSQVDLRILRGSRGCDNANNDSLVVLARSQQGSFLFMGDAEVDGDSDCEGEVPVLIDSYRNTNLLNIDVYKVGHHGSFNGTDEAFMRVMTPKISVISAGIHTQHGPGGFHGFQFGHPREAIVSLLERFSSDPRAPVNVYSMDAVRSLHANRHLNKAVYCTCWDGDIMVSTPSNGSSLNVTTSGLRNF